MDLYSLHQDIERGFVQLKDLDRFDRRRYLAWRLALRQIRSQPRPATDPIASRSRCGMWITRQEN